MSGRPAAGRASMKLDLHAHTEASHDCQTRLRDIPAALLERNVRVFAVTDHDQFWGGPELQRLVRDQGLEQELFIIAGEEITTLEGELVGLFLQERIAPGLSPEDTVREIKAQGGLVLLQHGFDPLKRYRLRPEATFRIREQIDIVEGFNARISRPRYNRAAITWARAYGLPISGGSDAHTLEDLGEAWSEAPFMPVHTPGDLLRALWLGQLGGTWTPPMRAFALKQLRQWQNRPPA